VKVGTEEGFKSTDFHPVQTSNSPKKKYLKSKNSSRELMFDVEGSTII